MHSVLCFHAVKEERDKLVRETAYADACVYSKQHTQASTHPRKEKERRGGCHNNNRPSPPRPRAVAHCDSVLRGRVKKQTTARWCTNSLAGLLHNGVVIADGHQQQLLEGSNLLCHAGALRRVLRHFGCTPHLGCPFSTHPMHVLAHTLRCVLLRHLGCNSAPRLPGPTPCTQHVLAHCTASSAA